MSTASERLRRVEQYCVRNDLIIDRQLGFGVHGSVFAAHSQGELWEMAVKGFERQSEYLRERNVYLRLTEHGISNIRGCAVPDLLAFDDELLVLEMTVVMRPFVLDFAGAYLDKPPDFPEEVMAEWRDEKKEQFEERWPEVQRILWFLQGLGIYVIDVTPNNISWPKEEK